MPDYQALASSISALALFWEARLASNSLRTRLGLNDDQWTADDKTNAEPLPVSLINTLEVKDGKNVRNLTDDESLLLKTSLIPFTPFADSWLSIDLKLPMFISASTLFESFLNDICGQFMTKTMDASVIQQRLSKIDDWNGWKEQLFEHGILTVNTLGRAADEKLIHIFELKTSIGKFNAGNTDLIEMTEGFITDTLHTVNDMTTLILRSSGWKLMTRMQG